MGSMQSYQPIQPQLAVAHQLEGPGASGAAQPEPASSKTRRSKAGGGPAASKAPKPKQAPSTHASQSVAAIYAEAAMRGVPPITLAMQQRGAQAVRGVLAAGACPNTPCDEGMLPLAAAILLNRADVAQALLDGGASLYLPGEHGWPALLSAAARGRTEVLELLLAAGAPVDQPGGGCGCGCIRRGETALIVAAEKGQLAAVQLLLRRGAEVDARSTGFGRTALNHAAEEGHVSVMRVLLRSGADVEARSDHGTSALMAACHDGRLQAARLLIAHGASLDLVCGTCCATCDRPGMTALVLTAYSDRQSEEGQAAVASALIDAGASLDVQDDNKGYTAAMWAACEGNLAVLQVLAEAGADLDVVSWEGEDALLVALRCFREAVAEGGNAETYAEAIFLLLENGAAVDTQTGAVLAALGFPVEVPPAAAAADCSTAVAEVSACCPGSCGAPAVCAAPGCTNTGRLRRCGGCRVVRYCGEACRDAHWREHKAECKRLQVAAAAGSKASEAAC